MTQRQRKQRYRRRRAAQAVAAGAASAALAGGVVAHVHRDADETAHLVEASELPTAEAQPLAVRFERDEAPRLPPLQVVTVSFAGTTASGVASPWQVLQSEHPGIYLDWD